MKNILPFLVILASSATVEAQVKGTPIGFAKSVTGGGSAAAATPTSLAQLTSWLTDSTARTIMIAQTWDYTGSEGTTTGTCCTSTCTSGTGQQTIATSCGTGQSLVSCTYDTAGRSAISIGSNKSIVGVGSAGVIKGKGFVVEGGNSNVIIQNIHFTYINPQYVWGGDAILLDNSDLVWIDHCKFSLIGRQMLVSGFEKAGRVTISNNEFDGVTSWSSSCNGKHYWTMLFAGAADQYTLFGNWIHDTSGRGPHIGTTTDVSEIFMHAVNNYYQNVPGHAWDIDDQTYILLEGNQYDSVTTPMTSTSLTTGAEIYDVVTVDEAGACANYLGYICEWNKGSGSGTVVDVADTAVLSKASSYTSYLVTHTGVGNVAASVTANAGIGKI
ncbi:putative pectin lyase F-1 [Neopestalotiopsis sp. 37M]|nr:putative pectin lyase F-1 [Neopestalotiopsis sp. 37M]